MIKLGDPLPETYRWHYFIPRSSAEGRAWYEEYRDAQCFQAGIELDLALDCLRRRQIAPGKQMLDRSKSYLDALCLHASPAVARVVERWYHSTHAYYLYSVGALTDAKQALNQARTCMEEAIEEAPFLVVLASACCEFSLHYARIARRQRDWTAMSQAIEEGRAMAGGRSPLCRLGSGRPIFYSDIDDFLRTITPADETERETLNSLLNPSTRVSGFESAIRQVEMLPNVVVPFA